QMAAMNVSELVRDNEIERIEVIAAGFDEVGIEHDKPSSPEPGRESVQDSAGLHQIDVGHTLHADPLCDIHHPVIERWHLLRAELDRAAAHMRNQRQMREKEKQAENDAVNQADD